MGARTYNHWFDGLAMLHRFGFAQGRVSYANRFLKSKAFTAAEATGKITYAEFATDPCRSLFGRVAAIFDPKLTDNCNVNVVGLGGETVAFTETAMPLRFSPETLATLGVLDYEPPLNGQVSIAHPHYDAARECHYSYMVEFGLDEPLSSVQHRRRRQPGAGRRDPGRSPRLHARFRHDRALSRACRVPADRQRARAEILRQALHPELSLATRARAEFHVVDKESGAEVATAHGDAIFAFHHVNAFEDKTVWSST